MAASSVGRRWFAFVGVPALVVALAGLLWFWSRSQQLVNEANRSAAAAISELVATAFSLHAEAPKGSAHHAVTDAIHSNWRIFDDVVDLRVIDRDGVIRWSRHAEEEGKVLSDARRLLQQTEPTIVTRDGLTEATRPLGGMACAGCHMGEPMMRAGVLDLTLREPSLVQRVDVLFDSTLRMLVGFGVLLTAALLLSLHLLITRPLRRLAAAMHRAEEGDFVVRADVAGAGEIAALATSFNRMLARLTELKASEIDTHRDLQIAQEQLGLKQALEQTNMQLHTRVTELSLLFDMARSLTSALELPELLSRMSRLISERLRIPQFSIMLVGREGALEVKSAYPTNRGTESLTFKIGEGACGRAAESRKSVYLPDLSSDDSIFVTRGRTDERGSLLAVPMVHKDQLLGVLNFQRPEAAAFSSEEIELLTAVADQAALAVKNTLLYEETVALSITDPLTGVPNRRHLFARLEMEIARANRFGNQLSVLMVDIDHFKLLNDTAGHRAGDVILRQVCDLMKSMTRKVDTLARYGGEEFMLLLPQVTKAEAVEVAEKLRRGVEEATFAHGKTQPGGRITVSIGAANLPVDAAEMDKLVDCADSALYASKRGGRNKVTGFAPGMEVHPGRERGPNVQRRPRAQES